MSRVTGSGPDDVAPRIDAEEVARFFRGRAERIGELGPTRAVIYQDKHSDLAERRDIAERTALLPLLDLHGTERLLDVGCGTGRWTRTVASLVASYHGVDLTEELIDYARTSHHDLGNVRFSVASVTDLDLVSLGESRPFDRVLCAGVLIYLNDDDLERALRAIRDCIAPETGRLLLREPVAQTDRLTLVEHFSTELDTTYNAIYRTRDELIDAVGQAFEEVGFTISETGNVFENDELNNRTETRQEWFVVQRRR